MRILDEHPSTVFSSPADATAPAPPESRGLERDAVRLLVAGPDGVSHARVRDLASYLEPGDLVVVNDSATVAGELDAERLGAGPVVLHLATPLDDGTWVVEVRTAPSAERAILDAAPGDRFLAGSVVVDLVAPYPRTGSSPTGHGNRLWRASVSGPLPDRLAAHGRPIAYGYLPRRYPLSAYQTIFGTRPGSAEMPSAGRPFTPRVVTDLVARGVTIAPVTLHTGVSSQEAGEAPQAERYQVPETTARLVNTVRAGGGRIVAVGTTVTRALESAVEGDRVVARSGWTDRVVTPLHPPRIVTGLVTGWHDPQASHLLLVEAVAGRELSQRAYDEAVAHGYQWHEFGDTALLLP
ncbi:S-adenosylmethionine:tRNA ribosyltransferase-isomerase [Nocardioides marmoriginsengisoli]|uniref:S-adenosylmethionine:tRNA ribosyltransferase-isomerase n=1 Tax=Nocardioides marmoriginsengisoli TaxID=661483 RepID=A0A3N0CNY2_9ACTN|nr:S-adenosylmethionine:tRNA ribosyltransferase-isomerase [Nocardioides marmoriginsengisoli]RNL65029.1 S-adenosylmethionine:tRNA ribosyltransferase-isomerase [Nocardioides marmoriginsengisoli]